MKKIYQTEDGQNFDTEDLAAAHEDLLDQLKPADAFKKALEDAGWEGPALTRRYNAAREFLMFLASKETPVITKKSEPKKKKPK